MKRLLPTLILVVICIGAFWYVKSQSFYKQEDPIKPLITATKQDITSFRVKTETLNYTLEKKNDTWEMTKPSGLPMNSYGVEQWLNAYIDLKQEGVIEENPADYKTFGLSEPLQEFEVKFKDGTVKTLQVGEKLPIEGFQYAKWKDEPTVFKVADSKVKALGKEQYDYMDRTVFQFKPTDTLKLELEWQGKKWTIAKDTSATPPPSGEEKWTLNGKVMTPEAAAATIPQLQFMNAETLVKAINEVKLDAPDFKLIIQEKNNVTQTYNGKVIDEVLWVAKQGGTWAYPLTLASINEINEIFEAVASGEAEKPATP